MEPRDDLTCFGRQLAPIFTRTADLGRDERGTKRLLARLTRVQTYR